MRIDMNFKGIERVQGALDKLDGPQRREAFAAAINDTAFQVRRQMISALGSAFDRPTTFIRNSPKVVKATAATLSAQIIPTLDARNVWSGGGKIGVDPQDVLQAQEFGGARRDKRSEVALRRAGILPAGHQTAIPATPYPGTDDGNGNLRGTFLQQLLSYLQAYGEQGFKANMTVKRRKSIHKGTAKNAGRRYFVSYGKLRSGKTAHLAAGIWAASGTHGVDVRPVLMFVRRGSYRPRISMAQIAQRAGGEDYLARRLRYRIRVAAGE